MSSTVKKGEKGKTNNQASLSKETPPSSNKITPKIVDSKAPDMNRTADQLNPKLQVLS